MKKKQRAQVVELLRCAADVAITETWNIFGPGATASARLKLDAGTRRIAEKAAKHAAPRGSKRTAKSAEQYIHVMLEAARLVEEGSYP
jgi:hypothetical protein